MSRLSRRSRGLILLILLMVPSLLSDVPFNTAMGEPSEGSISFQPSEMPNLTFDYNVEEYRFEFTWREYYLHLEPFVIYNNQTLEFYQIIPWIKNNYPQVDYRWAVTKFSKYHRWGYWLENLPQNVADNLDYLGFRLDYNFPLSAVEIEWVETPNYTFPRIQLGKAITLDFADLYEHGFTLEVNKTHLMIGNVKGKTDLDLDPITYSSPTITVTGYTELNPCTFWDIWNASNVNGWGMVSNNNNTDRQYEFNSFLIIGDGDNETWLVDEKVMVLFNRDFEVGGLKQIHVKSNAYLVFGRLSDDIENKTTNLGCEIMFKITTGKYGDGIFVDSGGRVYLYGSVVHNIGSAGRTALTSTSRVWNTMFIYGDVYTLGDFYNVIMNMPYMLRVMGGTLDEVSIATSGYVLGFFYSLSSTLSNVRGKTYGAFSIYASNIDDKVFYLIDCELNKWTINWQAGSTGVIYRQYTFNVLVVDNLGNPIENANVSLTYSGQGGGSVGTWETPDNGSIPEQTISKGFYNQTGGDTIYPYEPYNLTVSALGYDTESFIFNITEPTDWTIGLREYTIDVEVNTGLGILPIFLGFMALVVILAANRRRR